MYERFTDRARKVMQLANEEAIRFNHEYVGTEHVLLGLVREGSGIAANVLKLLDVDLWKVRQEVEKIVQAGPEATSGGKLPQTPRTRKVIEYALDEARNLGHNHIGTEHLLLGLLREEESVAAQVLRNLGASLENIRAEVMKLLGVEPEGRSPPHAPAGKVEEVPPKAAVLKLFGQDLTEQARQGKLNHVVCRGAEVHRLMEVLCRRTRCNPMLVGPPGVGKSALVQLLARRIVEGVVPPPLRERRLVHVDLGLLFYRTAFGELQRLGAVLREAQQTQALLYLDRVALLTGKEAPLGALPLLEAAVAHGEVQVLLSALPEEQARLQTEAPALSALFQPVVVGSPSAEEAAEILLAHRERLEKHHQVTILPEAAAAVLAQAGRCFPERPMPAQGLDLLDEAAVQVRLRSLVIPTPVQLLDARVQALERQKEAAVTAQDFEKAAQLRDQTDQLRRQRDEAMRQWQQAHPCPDCRVDVAAVEDAVSRLIGGSNGCSPTGN
jgi:ATP-dependent Clp protease ATP-binding subunit ClpC